VSDRSYGLQVAQLAGIPFGIIEHAKKRLSEMESREIDLLPATPQNDLFNETHPIAQALQALDPDEMSPRQAHDALCELIDKFV